MNVFQKVVLILFVFVLPILTTSCGQERQDAKASLEASTQKSPEQLMVEYGEVYDLLLRDQSALQEAMDSLNIEMNVQ